MEHELKTVGDAIKMQSECIELSSVIERMAEEIPGLAVTARENLVRAAKLIDFVGDELIPNLRLMQ